MSARAIPGYRTSRAGLLIPESILRGREVWTRAESQAIDRAAKLLQSRGISLRLACGQCWDGSLTLAHDEAGDRTLTCACKVRVLTRAH